MGEISGIAWTDATFNPWWGCARVSPGCDHCYAEELATTRRKLPVWGAHAERKPMSEAYWREPLKWNRKAEQAGARKHVFCASMADVFESPPAKNTQAWRVITEARARLWHLIYVTPWLDWLLLTKRPQNIVGTAPWVDEWPRNVWLGVTAEDQKRANERVPRLLGVPATVRFVSYEPALERVDFREWLAPRGVGIPVTSINGHAAFMRGLDWLIVGGESGAKARPFAMEWAEDAVQQTRGTTCAPFMKQLGAYVVSEGRTAPPDMFVSGDTDDRPRAENGDCYAWRAGLKDRKGGDPAEWPSNLQVRAFPTPFVRV